jgi:uncharacterized protein YwqG
MTEQEITERLLLRNLPPVLAAYAPALEEFKLPQIVVHPTRAKGLAPWVSKLCGLPYWQKNAEYPHDVNGQPMAMLVQLNFRDLPPLLDYPRAGIVQFFISISPDEGECPHDYGMRTDGKWQHGTDSEIAAYCDQRYFRMVYHEHVTDDLAALHLETPELPYGLLPMRREASLSCTLRDSYVHTSDYRFARVFGMDVDQLQKAVLNDDFGVIMEYWKFLDQHIPIVVGGYSRTEQGYDPRLIRRDEDWLVLLSIDTTPHNDVYMAWGDGGVANWWIKREDLARGDFSHVMYFCDSG